MDAWLTINHPPDDNSTGLTAALNHPTFNVDPTPFLLGAPILPPANEKGWKDTIQMNPGEVTRIRVRFATAEGRPFPFDARVGGGYVWHCHIIDHEDNEMMRPYLVV
jgi:FtsP/CotA-like multicopper oxidase with cupredoxin domain